MKVKHGQIIDLLMGKTCTSTYLAESLCVSKRSIINYVKEINNEYSGLISPTKDGYIIDKEKAANIIANNDIPQTSDERCFYIINELLHHHKGSTVDLFELCDELYVSLSTLKLELNKVKRMIKKFNLKLEIKNNEISCVGLEKDKRKLLSSILYKESNANFVSLESIQKAFLDIDIAFIKETVFNIFDKYHYFINDYSLVNLILHIAIAIDRIKNNNINKQDVDDTSAVKLHEYSMSEELAHILEKHFNIKFSNAEIYEMTLLLISRATNIDYQSINTKNLEQFVGKDCLKLVDELLNNIGSFYYIDLSEPEFKVRFALHIKNLLVRSQNNYFSKNPLAESIKISCPLIYDSAVNAANTIKERTGISINSDEIAYIAFHFGSAIETQKSLESRIKAVLYCPSYYNLNSKIIDAIYKNLENEILIDQVITEEYLLSNFSNTDLVITTIPLTSYIKTEIIKISPFINDKDLKELKNKITEIKTIKKKKDFEKKLRQLLNTQLFEISDKDYDFDTCIEDMVNKLSLLGYVENSFKDEIIERENISSTSFGNFAIPHAMKMNARKTGISILISNNSINWHNNNVNLVIMMCFNRQDRYLFNELYEPITMILSEYENVKALTKAKSYDEFINIIVEAL